MDSLKVLYYPYLSLPKMKWLNPAILFFDKIGVITPEDASQEDLFDKDTARLKKRNFVEPIWPGYYYNWESKADELLLEEILNQQECYKREQRDFALSSKLHAGKLAYTSLLTSLRDAKLVQRASKGDWYLTPEWVAIRVMTHLASHMAANPHLSMDLITDNRGAATSFDESLVQEKVPFTSLHAACQLLPVRPDIDVEEVLDFKERHGRHLSAFKDYVRDFVLEGSSWGTTSEERLEKRLAEAVELRKEIEALLNEKRLLGRTSRVILSAIPLIGSLADNSTYGAIASAVPIFHQLYNEYDRSERVEAASASPMAYAALAGSKLRRPLPDARVGSCLEPRFLKTKPIQKG